MTFANDVSSNCVVPLAEGYNKHFRVQYKSDKAIRQIMQLPVVVFRLREKLFATEYRSDMNYDKFVQFINMLVPASVLSKGLSKESLKMLCDVASSEKDKKLIRVAATEAKAKLGVSDLVTERETVCKALKQYIDIRDAVDKVVRARDTASVEELGIHITYSDSDSDRCSDGDDIEVREASREGMIDITRTQSFESEHFDWNRCQEINGKGNTHNNNIQPTSSIKSAHLFGNSDAYNITKERTKAPEALFMPCFEHLLLLLRENDLNWFILVAEMKLKFHQLSSEAHDQLLLDFSEYLPSSDLTTEEEVVVEKTRQAFLALQRERSLNRCEENIDIIAADSESDNPEWVRLRNLLIFSDEVQKIKKQCAIFQRQRKRKIEKTMSSKCLLRRKAPPRASKSMKKFPDIRKVIEDFAQERRVGADSWRRTGLLTFSGNVKRGARVTYRRIKDHLEKTYHTKFGYGTVVQLCSVHNKRKLSSRRYLGWGGGGGSN